MADNARWYVAHTYSGYENAVKTTIEKFVTNRHLEDMILDIQIPMEKVTEINDAGVAKEVERKVFPGYVLIKMVMTDDTWHLLNKEGDRVRNSDGPLESFTGVVEEIDAEKNKVTVVVSMFGRETPVELELDQVEVVD